MEDYALSSHEVWVAQAVLPAHQQGDGLADDGPAVAAECGLVHRHHVPGTAGCVCFCGAAIVLRFSKINLCDRSRETLDDENGI